MCTYLIHAKDMTRVAHPAIDGREQCNSIHLDTFKIILYI